MMGYNLTGFRTSTGLQWAFALLIAGAGASQPLQATTTDHDRAARAVAGLEYTLKGFGKEEEDQWRAASREIGQYWGAYERRIGSPMRQWGCQELASAEGRTVFYPFSGPDLPSVALLYPDASRYAMVSMQRAGPPPDLQALNSEQLGEYLIALRKAWKSYGTLGYFRTDDLEADRKSAGPRLGVTGPLMAFAARLGFTMHRVEPIQLDVSGNVVPVTGEAARSA